jgi:hypothetical protein
MRWVALGGVVLSLALLLTGAQAQDEIAAEIQKTNSPPNIDGLGDDPVWAAATAHSIDEFFNVGGGEELDGDEDLQTTWKAVWDDTNLYVLIEVQDDELVYDESNSWEDDSVEIYIDAQNLDEPEYNPDVVPEIPSYQFTAIAGQEPIDDTTSLFTWGINSYDDNAGARETQYPQGEDVGGMVTDDESGTYALEVSFPWEALEETPANILARGDFGFGIAVNDDDDGGGRNTQIMWATESPDLWHNASVFPSVALSTEVIGGGTPGDFNGDGNLDGADIDDLTGQSAGGTNPAAYDLNADALVNDGDVNVWVKDLFNSWIGDADLNGEFNSSDLVAVLASGTYEADVASVWTTGDFNGDGRTNSGDLVAALADGGYEVGPRAATAAVPEPAGMALLTLGLGGLITWRRCTRRR